jgi:hypothetical protein
MNRIHIRNIGPIKDVTLDLNKINVIMGPQSSGKSTIAKIVSYCQWVEKRFILDGKFKYDFSEQFMDFHRISNVYFNDDSLIEYKSNAVHISYKGLSHEPLIKRIKQGISFVNCKNIYIPAERNFVSTIQNLGKYKRVNDNIMNFVYDWYDAKKTYTKEHKFSVLNLDVSYFHIQETDSDMLALRKAKKELLLNHASSGLQSVVPMLLLLDFLSSGLYKIKPTESVDEKEEKINVFLKHFVKILAKDKIKMNEIVSRTEKEQKISMKFVELENILDIVLNRTEYHFSRFIIEEPEQNLFPETQRDLVYYMLRTIINNNEHDHKLLITTHSPYILYALNNCMLGYLVKAIMPKKEQNELASKFSWIDPSLVSVWEIEKDKGTIKLIQDEKTGTVSKHYFNKIMNDVMDEYYAMLNYLEI